MLVDDTGVSETPDETGEAAGLSVFDGWGENVGPSTSDVEVGLDVDEAGTSTTARWSVWEANGHSQLVTGSEEMTGGGLEVLEGNSSIRQYIARGQGAQNECQV